MVFNFLWSSTLEFCFALECTSLKHIEPDGVSINMICLIFPGFQLIIIITTVIWDDQFLYCMYTHGAICTIHHSTVMVYDDSLTVTVIQLFYNQDEVMSVCKEYPTSGHINILYDSFFGKGSLRKIVRPSHVCFLIISTWILIQVWNRSVIFSKLIRQGRASNVMSVFIVWIGKFLIGLLL